MKFKEKLQSKKFMLVILIIVLATLGAFAPPIVNLFLGTALKILTGAEWVTVISLVISAYIAGNAWQNRAEISNAYVEDTHIRTIVQESKSDVTADEEFEDMEEAEA